ncbi:MAG: hypothetical protein KC435_10110 [Thermomicrobiales bacterium]|nr:hypothetical protein [Thermomicrobiales bacterium]
MIPRASKLSVLVVLLLLSACGGGDNKAGDEATSTTAPAAKSSSPEVSISTEGTESGAISSDDQGTCSHFTAGKFQSDAEFQKEVYACVDVYDWPVEYPADASKIVERSSDPNSRSELGLARGLVGTLNQCSWTMTWLDAYKTGDTERQAEAMTVMTDDIPYYYDGGDDGIPDRNSQRIVEGAEMGDPTEAQLFVTANCQPAYWVVDP